MEFLPEMERKRQEQGRSGRSGRDLEGGQEGSGEGDPLGNLVGFCSYNFLCSHNRLFAPSGLYVSSLDLLSLSVCQVFCALAILCSSLLS